ncbi:S41 family peptidase [Xanthocytophaga flava]|uniref:S41 family peptidase n=1 Tax=Xanthocytophaga flava TaxID=3048013 RepID=UPI0028D1F3E6|nr:S41 family peptidase [Xanthocytophaga flavus]MDJ1468200.1 S41 family peptidase [Xanthocytophaga flavus]
MFFFCFFKVLTSLASPQTGIISPHLPERSYFKDSLTKQEAKLDLKILKTALLQAHPGLNLYQSIQDFESQTTQLEHSLPDKISLTSFLEALSRLVASIRCGHTSIGISENQMQSINQTETFFPFPIKIIEGRAWIDLAFKIDGKNLLGAEIVSINGRSVASLLTRLASLVTTDGNNKTLPDTYLEDHFYLYYLLFVEKSRQFDLILGEQVQEEHIDSSGRFFRQSDSAHMQSTSRTLYSDSIFFTEPVHIRGTKLTHCRIASVSKQTVIENYKNRVSLSLFYRQTGDKKVANINHTSPSNHHTNQTCLNLLKDKKTAILTITSFDNEELRKQNIRLKQFLKDSFDKLASNNISSLVLDIRQNTGGDEGNEDLLLSYLVDKPYRKYQSVSINPPDYSFLEYTYLANGRKARKFRKSLQNEFSLDSNHVYTRKDGFFKPTKLHKPTFKGNVYVLIGGRVFSGASEFITLLDQNRQTVFIGQESGGNYYGNTSGEYISVHLLNSDFELTIPLCLYRLSVTQTAIGQDANTFSNSSNTKNLPRDHGLVPDYQIYQTLSDLKSGRDTLIDYTLQLISKKR